MCGRCLSRRGLLAALAAASLAGCSENAVTGRSQLVFVDDAQLAGFADQAWDEVVAKVPPVKSTRPFGPTRTSLRPESVRPECTSTTCLAESPRISTPSVATFVETCAIAGVAPMFRMTADQ